MTTTARRVELIIRQLNSLSTFPEVAAGFLSTTAAKKADIPTLTEIIEADPALTAKVFSLAYNESVEFSGDKPTVKEAVAKLPADMIRDVILSLRIFHALDSDKESKNEILPGKELALHALATGCCAEEIAKLAFDQESRKVAFSAGLLHDIGKLALAEAMPKSFERIAADAKENNLSFQQAEKKHLGIDHTIIGKRLAEKWHLPTEITFAIWLHHSDTEGLSGNMQAGKLAQVVALADIVARQLELGLSGSYDYCRPTDEIVDSLGISAAAFEEIKKNLPARVAKKTEMLGLKNPGGQIAYSQLVRETAEKLADKNKSLIEKNQDLATNSAYMNLISDFLEGLRPDGRGRSHGKIRCRLAKALPDRPGMYLPALRNR